jgi:hypothetical protein
MSDTPRTDAAAVSREYIEREMDRYTQKFVLADRMSDLERELAEAKEQLRLCNVDQFTTAAELAETSKALRIAVGLLSTYPKLSSEHPEYTLEYILNIAAMKEGGK